MSPSRTVERGPATGRPWPPALVPLQTRTATAARASAGQPSLCELLDRVLNRGVVLTGEVVISVAGVPLLYLGLNVVLASVATLLGETAGPSHGSD